jgi:hypothetical protein
VYVTYTCAHAHTRTRARTHTHNHRQSHAQMSHRRFPSPTRTLCLCCCQIKAWKARHKGECKPAARADTRTGAKPTADQMRVLKTLAQLASAADWRRSARPGRRQLPCGLPCRTVLRLSIAPSAKRISRWGTFPRRSSTTRST